MMRDTPYTIPLYPYPYRGDSWDQLVKLVTSGFIVGAVGQNPDQFSKRIGQESVRIGFVAFYNINYKSSTCADSKHDMRPP